MLSAIATRVIAVSFIVTLAGCGGGDRGNTFTEPPPPPTPAATTIEVQGAGQTARIGQPLSTPPAVVVKDQAGKAMAGVTVTFAVSTGGGTLVASFAITGSTGSATLPTWTLGTTPGVNSVTATAVGGATPSAQILATARPPRWTVLVYMAADNNLAQFGVGDIDEMEAAGSNPEVQVVLQAEFNPTAFAQAGLTPTAAHLPNFNTVRYGFGGLTPLAGNVLGPNGAVTDIGNRTMTDATQLREFINWGQQTYPAERYALVLWNHGGGYQGLLGDDTSAPGKMMSLPELKTALTGVGGIELIDFDMCLMGGYETLVAVNGLAKFAAFSEEVEPGEGDAYTPVLQALNSNPTMDGRALAAVIVEQYNTFYVNRNDRSSTTKSAYDLSGLASFEAALAVAAQTLTANIGSVAPTVAASATKSQSFKLPIFKDIADLIDSLSATITDSNTRTQLAAVKSQATASTFRISNRTRNGSASWALPVTKASGLSIVLPSGASDDWFQPAGYPLSLGAYQTAMPNKPWAQFLTAYSAQITAPGITYVDQGTTPWQVYLLWDSAAVSRNADLDLWVIEPDGNVYIPYLGTVTANGVLSGESQDSRTYYEGYEMRRYVQTGRYYFYANMWTDPLNFRPAFDIVYRQGELAAFTSLYAPNYPRMSVQTSWLADPTPTFAEADAGNYTDLVQAAYLDIVAAAPSSAPASISPVGSSLSVSAASSARFMLSSAGASALSSPVADGADARGTAPRITAAQLATVRANWTTRERRRLSAGGARSSVVLPRRPTEALKLAPRASSLPHSTR